MVYTPMVYEPKPEHLFSFGEPVVFNHRLVRRMRWKDYRYGSQPHQVRHDQAKVWVEEELRPNNPLPVKGLWIGMRRLSDGIRVHLGYEEGIVFEPERSFWAHLVVYSELRSPVYVLHDNLRVAMS